jgi:hypothetical protein
MVVKTHDRRQRRSKIVRILIRVPFARTGFFSPRFPVQLIRVDLLMSGVILELHDDFL